MSTPDPTMTALLGAHRAELDDRDQRITNLEYQSANYERMYKQEQKNALGANSTAQRRQATIDEQRERITKLEGIIETLRIELATERTNLTTARDIITTIRAHVHERCSSSGGKLHTNAWYEVPAEDILSALDGNGYPKDDDQ